MISTLQREAEAAGKTLLDLAFFGVIDAPAETIDHVDEEPFDADVLLSPEEWVEARDDLYTPLSLGEVA